MVHWSNGEVRCPNWTPLSACAFFALRVAEDERVIGVATLGRHQRSFGRFEIRLAISADSSGLGYSHIK
jgi:hypothetical protein